MKNSRIQIKFSGFQTQVSKFSKKRSATNAKASFRQVSRKSPKLVILKRGKNLASLVIVDYIQVSKNSSKKISGFQLAKPACLLLSWQVSKFPDFTTSITWRVNNPPCMEWGYRFFASPSFALLSTKNLNRHEQQKNFSSRSRNKNRMGNQIRKSNYQWHN